MAAELKARLTLNNSQFIRTLRGSLTEGKRFGNELASRGFAAARVGLMGVAAAAVISGGALAVGVKSAYDLGGSLSDLSTRTGITAGRLLVMQRAFMDSGLAADETGTAVNRMQRFLVAAAEGGGEASKAMKAMNLTLEDFAGLTPDRQFELVSSAINGIQDASLRADTAMAIFGRSGAKLLTLFADRGAMSTAGRVLGKQAEILDKRSNDFDAISDKLGRAGAKLQGFFVGVAASLAGTIGPLLDRFEGMDFAGLGERFGASLLGAADSLLGAFRNPEAALGGLKSYAGGAMSEAGNRLVQGFSGALAFFRDGGTDIISGLGRLLLGTLLDVFSTSAADFQARLQATIALLDPRNAKDAVSLVNIDRQLDKNRSRLEAASAQGNAPEVERLMGEINGLTAMAKEITNRMQGGSVEERTAAILASGGASVSMGAEGSLNASQLKQTGLALLSSGLSAGSRAVANAPYQDLFGSAEAFAAADSARASLTNTGTGIRTAATSAASAPARARNRYEGQLYEIYGSARAQQLISERDVTKAPRDPASAKTITVQEQIRAEIQKLTQTMQEAFAS